MLAHSHTLSLRAQRKQILHSVGSSMLFTMNHSISLFSRSPHTCLMAWFLCFSLSIRCIISPPNNKSNRERERERKHRGDLDSKSQVFLLCLRSSDRLLLCLRVRLLLCLRPKSLRLFPSNISMCRGIITYRVLVWRFSIDWYSCVCRFLTVSYFLTAQHLTPDCRWCNIVRWWHSSTTAGHS